jgi:hypothetical protein
MSLGGLPGDLDGLSDVESSRLSLFDDVGSTGRGGDLASSSRREDAHLVLRSVDR